MKLILYQVAYWVVQLDSIVNSFSHLIFSIDSLQIVSKNKESVLTPEIHILKEKFNFLLKIKFTKS